MFCNNKVRDGEKWISFLDSTRKTYYGKHTMQVKNYFFFLHIKINIDNSNLDL